MRELLHRRNYVLRWATACLTAGLPACLPACLLSARGPSASPHASTWCMARPRPAAATGGRESLLTLLVLPADTWTGLWRIKAMRPLWSRTEPLAPPS